MTAEPNKGELVFDWMLAPPEYVTRRQLRAAGKGPNRQGVQAWLKPKREGGKLFDLRKAGPKRVPSPAQEEAIRKATEARQFKTAAKRGFSRAEMTTETDPGPGWVHTPTEKEEKIMSDNKFQQGRSELVDSVTARFTPVPVPTASAPAAKSADLSADAQEQLGLDTPTGHGQRMAYLLATVAVNQARYRDQRLAKAVEQAQAAGPDAVEELMVKSEQTQARAEARLQARRQDNPTAAVQALADALVWHPNSEIATKHLRQLTYDYAEQWGVVVDADEFAVSIDPNFDAVDAQDHAEAWRLFDRESTVMDFVSAMPLTATAKDAAMEAITAWQGIGISPADPRAHLRDEAARREQLSSDLAAAKLTESDRARVEFVVDYLRGNTADVDLLDSPVVVDPGEEARGRVPRLLELFANNPKAAKVVGEEISVMTKADQERVRQAGKEIARGGEVDFQLWPDYVDRYDLGEALAEYAAGYGELRSEADYLATGGYSEEEHERLGAYDIPGVGDETGDRITRLTEQREQLRATIHNSLGLAPVERAQLSAVLGDIDAGRIRGHQQLPELLFADERTKADADVARVSMPASRLSAATREAITQRIEASGVDPQGWDGDRLKQAVSSIEYSIYTVACGARGNGGIADERKSYIDKRARLGKELVKAGVGEAARTGIRELLDERARQAGELGRAAAQREQQWKAKVDRAVTDRNDAIAQRQAAAAGRASGSGRARAPRPDRDPAQEAHVQAQARAQAQTRAAGRRQLHSPEVGR